MLLQADVAVSAVVFVFLSEITEQHAAPAFVIGFGIRKHGFDTLDVTFLPVFVYFIAQVNAVGFLPFSGVDDVRGLFPGNVMQDASSGQKNQNFVYLLSGKSGAACQ